MIRFAAIFLFIFTMLGPALAAKDRVFSLEVENDVLTPTDRYFTNGLRVAVGFGAGAQKPWMVRLADKIPFLSKNPQSRIIGFAAGQNMYTPEETSRFTPIPDDRPYAGWLYAEMFIEVQSGEASEYFTLQLGMVGPASLAGPAQRGYHRLIEVDRPNGWDNQLKNEPGIVIAYQWAWTKAADLGGGLEVSSSPHLGLALGNIYTYAAGGWTVRFGTGLAGDHGPPPRISPALPGSNYFKHRSKFAWYLFAGFEVRGVARDIFLDGNSYQQSLSIEKNHLVADVQVGLVVLVGGLRIAYTHVFRTEEFKGQAGRHEFSGVNISFRF